MEAFLYIYKNLKTKCLRREVLHFTSAQCLTPKPLVTQLCMWGPVLWST